MMKWNLFKHIDIHKYKHTHKIQAQTNKTLITWNTFEVYTLFQS